jgi:hypothetical protein
VAGEPSSWSVGQLSQLKEVAGELWS